MIIHKAAPIRAAFSTWNYTWTCGRQLRPLSKGSFGEPGYDEITFSYNSDGLRTRKTRMYFSNGDIAYSNTEYTLHGKNIVHLTQNGNNLHFFYDASGKPAVVDFNGVKYGYIVNLQGDVLGLVDGNGNEVVKYTYDAWGKVLSTTGSLAATLGAVQPFRYRGYVYDVETGLYYLRSRYYNPEWGRFVNADILIKGNLYTYCLNAPTGHVDIIGNQSEPSPYGGLANCYAYALRLMFDPRTNKEFDHKPQPGEFSNLNNVVNLEKDKWLDRDGFVCRIINGATCDAEVLGMRIEKVESADYDTTETSWVVALATSYHGPKWDILGLFNHNYDYHWWRKEQDGTWTHKPGDKPIMLTDFSQKTIYDPKNSDRGIYNNFVGYFLVTVTKGGQK